MMAQQQQQEYMQQQMALQEQQRQQEEYMRQQWLLQQQQQQQQQQLQAQPTGYGSNNPFADRAPQQQSIIQEQPTSTPSFLPVPQVSAPSAPSPAFTPEPPKPIEPQQTARPFQPAVKKDDGQHSQLAGLLARGREDGLDTFGNVGNLRIPVGTGFHASNRMAGQQTGFGANNPFGQAQQGGQQQQQQQQNDQPFFSI